MWRDLGGALEFIEALQQLDKEKENGRINLPVSHSDKRSSEMLIELGHWQKCSSFFGVLDIAGTGATCPAAFLFSLVPK